MGFWGSPLGSPASQKCVPLTSIFAQEAAASTPREGVGVLFAVCALERPWRIPATDSGGNIYLTGNLGETADNGTANNLRNQVQLRSCHPRDVSQKGQVSFMLRWKQTANKTQNLIINAIQTSRVCHQACSQKAGQPRSIPEQIGLVRIMHRKYLAREYQHQARRLDTTLRICIGPIAISDSGFVVGRFRLF